MARLIYRDANLEVLHRPGASDFTLVVFNINGETPDGRYFWGEGFAERHGLNAIGVMGASNWHPGESMRAAAAALRPCLSGDVVGYGASMGGYAAIKYSGLLGACCTLAFSPQVSIDPADVPWDRRWVKQFDPALHAGMRVVAEDMAGRIAVFFDPHERADCRHAAMLPPGPVRVPMPFSSHGTVTTVAQAGSLPALIAAMRAGETGRLRGLVRASRRLSHHHVLEMALRRIAQRRFGWLGRIADRLAMLDDGPATAMLLHAAVLAGRGERAAAQAQAAAAGAAGVAHERVRGAVAALLAG